MRVFSGNWIRVQKSPPLICITNPWSIRTPSSPLIVPSWMAASLMKTCLSIVISVTILLFSWTRVSNTAKFPDHFTWVIHRTSSLRLHYVSRIRCGVFASEQHTCRQPWKPRPRNRGGIVSWSQQFSLSKHWWRLSGFGELLSPLRNILIVPERTRG